MALTNSELFEYAGRFLKWAITNDLLSEPSVIELVKAMANWRINGTNPPLLTDRNEVAKATQRFLFDITGKDPDIDLHFYKNHWLNNYVPGESDVLE